MSDKTRTRTTRSTASTTKTARTSRSVPDQTVATKVRTEAEDKLWEALHHYPNSTAANLSVAARIGKSTAQKILVRWASDGSVTRTTGSSYGRPPADLWAIADVDPTLAAPAQVDADTTPVDADGTNTTQAGPDVAVPVTPDVLDTDDAAPSEGDPDESTDIAANDAQGPVDPEVTDPAEAASVVAGVGEHSDDGAVTGIATATKGGAHTTDEEEAARLAPGALRGMVEDYLRDHPGEEFSPTVLAKALGGKSSGAVSNALDKLVADGTAVKTQDKPRRFALAPAEQAAAPASTS
ncbi:MarR family transcriptional regulator [Saccharothrix texasensis]|uniref:Uncharacterized protein n=1 Tax=Saccharothrix texasensis TaxID=103734 RepID=A0A3N1H482_9PSEU|nr:MarR family transcriptional regulator [Saccharothrix texasensis]ROP37327.1 hypothetical protein EDD40_2632 [Saccharothrix texasensis]